MLPIESSHYELVILVYSNFRRITHRVSGIQTVLMMKTTFLPTSLVYDLFFEGHAFWIWKWKLAPETRIIGVPGPIPWRPQCMTATNHVGHKPWRPQKWKITPNVQFTSFNIVA